MKHVSIIGMGALGIMYGAFIKEHSPDTQLDFVMDKDRAQKYKDTTFTVNDKEVKFNIVAAEDAVPCDLLMIAVKYTGLESCLDVMKNCIGPQTIVMSVLNGISSEEIITARYPDVKIIYTVAQEMDAMKFGNSLRYTKFGRLYIGARYEQQKPYVQAVDKWFSSIEMPFVNEPQIMYRMWSKFMLNVGINQCCAVFEQPYGVVLSSGNEANVALYAAFREVVAVAHAEGIELGEAEINHYVDILRTLDPKGTPSMGQDRINKRPSEVDMFAGAVMALGKKHGITVPTNEFLFNRMKEIEKEYI